MHLRLGYIHTHAGARTHTHTHKMKHSRRMKATQKKFLRGTVQKTIRDMESPNVCMYIYEVFGHVNISGHWRLTECRKINNRSTDK